MILETNPQLELAKQYIEETFTNIFLTGKAGTGKTTFLKNLRKTCFKRNVVVAPTGVAAINANGVTIHSFFQVSFGPFLPNLQSKDTSFKKFSKEKIRIIRGLDLLIIDEISMVRADLLDAIDDVLRRFRPGARNIPFGGVQLLMIGDLQQLPPVCKDEEWELISQYYSTPYFFSSLALNKSQFLTINLKKVFRQRDESFIKILNNIRNNTIDTPTYQELNKRYIPNFNPKDDEGYITLCTHNFQARDINNLKLNSIKEESFFYKAKVGGDFPEGAYPNDEKLELKLGSQIMFVKNDYSSEFSKRRYYNGKIGKIISLDDEKIIVRCIGEDNDIEVPRYEWHNYKYEINKETKAIEEKVIGTFEQYPIKLAWAITIHKSQGLTFDKVIINSNRAFASGQVYVAMSRCKTLEGIVITSEFNPNSVRLDNTLVGFDLQQENNAPTEDSLQRDRRKYLESSVLYLISFLEIKYSLEELTKLNNTEIYKIYTKTSNELTVLIKTFEKEVIEVSYKFQAQLNTIFQAQDDKLLNTRLAKAGEYFKEKLAIPKRIFNIANKLEFDNKEIRSKQNTILQKLFLDIEIKSRLLDLSLKEFSHIEYIKTKNQLLSTDEKEFLKEKGIKVEEEKKTIEDTEVLDVKDNELFEALRDWKYAKSRELDINASNIITHKSIIQIANLKPINEIELLQIKGMGKVRMKEYGNEILEIVQEYTSTKEEKGEENEKE
ncbi:MAG: HRDC domain-containing protein [Bacteroidales bacterium]